MLWIVYTLLSGEFLQLCYKYDIDVALCSSMVLFLLPFVVILVITLSFDNCSFSRSVCLLSILFLVTVCFLPSLANKRHH